MKFSLILAMHRYPWNVQTLPGYLAAVGLQYIRICSGILAVLSIAFSFVGCCKLLKTFTLDIKQSLKNLNNNFLRNDEDFIRNKLNDQFTDLIQLHSDAQE